MNPQLAPQAWLAPGLERTGIERWLPLADMTIADRLARLGFSHRAYDGLHREIWHGGQLIGLMDAAEAAEFLATQE